MPCSTETRLALRAGTTQRHISFMESGRSTPGRGMVLRVAESLELPLRERNETADRQQQREQQVAEQRRPMERHVARQRIRARGE